MSNNPTPAISEDERQRRLRAAFEHCQVRHYEAWRPLAQCDEPKPDPRNYRGADWSEVG